MASRGTTIYDLSGESAGVENSPIATIKKSTTAREPARGPFQILQNDSRQAPSGTHRALTRAIDTMSEARLRQAMHSLCAKYETSCLDFESRYLVKGSEVVHYHADTDSEDEGIADDEDGDGKETDDDESKTKNEEVKATRVKQSRISLPIAIADDMWTPRYATCENCKEEFDVTKNQERDCRWHSDIKIVDYDAEIWADHNEDCHGPCDSFENDPTYDEGFIWQCCDRTGKSSGCKATKHKARINKPRPDLLPLPIATNDKVAEINTAKEIEDHSETPPIPDKDITTGAYGIYKDIKIRNSEGFEAVVKVMDRGSGVQCDRCQEAYSPEDNEEMECQYHPGPKGVNRKTSIWYDHDEDCNGSRSIFIDDSNYAEGFMYECCGGQGDNGDREEGNHLPDEEEPSTLPSSLKRKAEEEMRRPATRLRV